MIAAFNAPHVDYGALAPVIALTAGICVVLLMGVFRPLKEGVGPMTVVVLAAAAGLLIAQWDEPANLISGAMRLDDLAIAISLIAIGMALFTVFLSIGERAVEEAGEGEYHALLLGSVLGMVLLAQAQNLVTFFVAIETLSIPLYILCATDMRREGSLESGLQVPDRRLARLGDAALRDGLHLRRLGLDRLRRDRKGDRADRRARRSADPGRDRDDGGRPGLQDLDRALPPVDARRLRGRADPGDELHGGGDQGGGLRGLRPLLRRRPRAAGRRLAAGARRPRRDLDRRRQRRRPAPDVPETDARLLRCRAGRLHPLRTCRRQRGGDQRSGLLPRRLRLHEPGRLCGDRRPRARNPLRRLDPRRAGPRRRAAAAGLAADDLDARPRRAAGHRGLHRQALPDRGAGRRRLHLARGLHRGRNDDLAGLLPARRRGDVDAARARRRDRGPRDRRRLARGRSDRPRSGPPGPSPRPGADRRRGGRLLRRHPAAAGRVRPTGRGVAVLP